MCGQKLYIKLLYNILFEKYRMKLLRRATQIQNLAAHGLDRDQNMIAFQPLA